jgi:hypothetical protein
MHRILFLMISSLSLLLAGCENDAASLMIEGKEHSISFVREQSIAWVGPVEQRFVVSRFPVCQRRYSIASGDSAMKKIDIYEVLPRLYVAKQGEAMYALGTEECVLQKFKPEDKPASVPGKLLGSFQKKDGKLAFVPAENTDPAR